MIHSEETISILDHHNNEESFRQYGTLRDDNWYYVIVFPNPPKMDSNRDVIIEKLHDVGLETQLFYSLDEKLVFCKLRASDKRLKAEAEAMSFRVRLDPHELRRVAETGIPAYHIQPFSLIDVKHTVSYDPYESIYAPYRQDETLQYLYLHHGETVFNSIDRIMLLEHIISNSAGYDLEHLVYDQVVIQSYPLHDDQMKQHLKQLWLTWVQMPMNQPFDAIWDYFGVKVSLYFLYLGHCTHWLLYPAIMGILVILLYSIVQDQSLKDVIFPLFGAFMTIWMTLYLENWKRVNARASLRWGTLDLEVMEELRPQFQGEWIPSPIDGRPTRWFDPYIKRRRILFSWMIIGLLILMVFALVASIFILRYDVTKGSDAKDVLIHIGTRMFSYGPILAALANVVQIAIMGKLYNTISLSLNNQENHRTDQEYENSLILKTMIFQFVNNYSGLFYVAFLKQWMEGCTISCMWELQYTYATVYFSRLITSNILEVWIPRFWMYITRYQLTGKVWEIKRDGLQMLSHAEKELFMVSYDWRGTFDDYTELVIQFGFTTMFVVAFPLAPFISFVINYLEIRVDAYRLLFETRRPCPQNVRNIGSWYQVLQVFTAISICTNTGVVLFTQTCFLMLTSTMRVWLFTLFITFMFLFKYVLEIWIDDMPHSVRAQQKRQEFFVNKCFYRDDMTSYATK